mmetsp:Transcript_23652/g.73281  ORF Transcript_23652/g.73281 Transcript_23652/m.73281 type:complete len:364 (+) Transcript_23652:278-1369(+)
MPEELACCGSSFCGCSATTRTATDPLMPRLSKVAPSSSGLKRRGGYAWTREMLRVLRSCAARSKRTWSGSLGLAVTTGVSFTPGYDSRTRIVGDAASSAAAARGSTCRASGATVAANVPAAASSASVIAAKSSPVRFFDEAFASSSAFGGRAWMERRASGTPARATTALHSPLALDSAGPAKATGRPAGMATSTETSAAGSERGPLVGDGTARGAGDSAALLSAAPELLRASSRATRAGESFTVGHPSGPRTSPTMQRSSWEVVSGSPLALSSEKCSWPSALATTRRMKVMDMFLRIPGTATTSASLPRSTRTFIVAAGGDATVDAAGFSATGFGAGFCGGFGAESCGFGAGVSAFLAGLARR